MAHTEKCPVCGGLGFIFHNTEPPEGEVYIMPSALHPVPSVTVSDAGTEDEKAE